MKTRVADTGSLTDGKGFCVKVGAAKLVLIKDGDSVRALENRCPHLGVPIGRGKIENGEITCPFHGSRFDIATGENRDWVSAIGGMKIPEWTSALLSFGKKPQALRSFAVTVEGADIFVDL